MKSWQIDDFIRSDRNLSNAVERAKSVFEEVLGAKSQSVDAQWKLSELHGKRVLELTISDWRWPKGVQSVFDPSDLESRSEMRSRFGILWGDLLQQWSHQLIGELLKEAV